MSSTSLVSRLDQPYFHIKQEAYFKMNCSPMQSSFSWLTLFIDEAKPRRRTRKYEIEIHTTQ